MSRRSFRLSFFPFALLATIVANSADAAPIITNVSLRGLQIGGKTTIVLDGSDFAPHPKLSLDIPAADIIIQPNASDKRLTAEVEIPAGVSPGVYPLRVCTDKGVSSPVLLGVDVLPQQPMTEKIEKLPVALHGRVAGNQILATSFEGKKGQRVVLDVEARRIGSPLEPVVRLYDARGAQIAWSAPHRAMAGDARCETLLPADGVYSIELHDRLYRASAPGCFRLKIGDLQYADMPFPLGATAGQSTSLSFVSGSLGAEVHVDVVPPTGAAHLPVDVSQIARFTGPQPSLVVSSFPELVEQTGEAAAPQMLPQPPAAVSGRVAAKGEEDVYHVQVKAGQKLRVSVLADRLGSPLDGVLTVRRKAGQQLAQNDDGPGTSDPVVEVTVPAGEDTLVVSLRDLRGEGSPDHVYRLLIEEVGPSDLSLSLDAEAINIPAGGTQLLEVRARRAGVRSPIELKFADLPPGVSVSGAQIAPGDVIGLVSLTADSNATASCVTTGITATAQEGGQSIEKPVLLAETNASQRQPWLREHLAVAVTAVAPIQLAWNDASADEMLLGGSTPLGVNLNRSADVAGKVRLRLATTQIAPKKTVKERNRDVQVDDEERTLRLAKAVEFTGNTADAQVRLAVPNDLKERPWSVALVAELLSADGKTVVATASTPVRRLTAKRAVELAITGENKIKALAGDGGETGVFKGAIKRMDGLSGPLTLTLTGLPAGYPAPKLEIAADANEFEFPIRFPAAAKAGELKDVRVVATFKTTADDEQSTVKSNELPVTLNVAKAPAP